MSHTTHQLEIGDGEPLKRLLALFTEVFADPDTYGSPPRDEYLNDLLRDPTFIAVVAVSDTGSIIGGLIAYELRKFEQERSEIYIYDLGVSLESRRQGVATSLIEALKEIARERNAWTIFVQADEDDDGAIALYRTLASEEITARHFDILP